MTFVPPPSAFSGPTTMNGSNTLVQTGLQNFSMEPFMRPYLRHAQNIKPLRKPEP
jgi:hypothetical protein